MAVERGSCRSSLVPNDVLRTVRPSPAAEHLSGTSVRQRTAKRPLRLSGHNNPSRANVSLSILEIHTHDNDLSPLRRGVPPSGMNGLSVPAPRSPPSRFFPCSSSPPSFSSRREHRHPASRSRRPVPPPTLRGGASGTASARRHRGCRPGLGGSRKRMKQGCTRSPSKPPAVGFEDTSGQPCPAGLSRSTRSLRSQGIRDSRRLRRRRTAPVGRLPAKAGMNTAALFHCQTSEVMDTRLGTAVLFPMKISSIPAIPHCSAASPYSTISISTITGNTTLPVWIISR